MIIVILKRGMIASDCGPAGSPLLPCVRGNVETEDGFYFSAPGKTLMGGLPDEESRVRRKAEALNLGQREF